jgi:hypothetical protein
MYRHAIASALICTALAVSQALAAEGGPRVTFTSYGAARVGMSLQALRDALGSRLEDDQWPEESCHYVSKPGQAGVSYMMLDGRVARIDVYEPSRVEAFAGGGIGMTEASIRRIYPSIRVTRHFYDEAGSYLTLLSKDKRYGIRFEVGDGKVKRYYAGRADAIHYVEGCE